MAIPAFQENGAFIGEQRYQQLLSMQRPPLIAAEFEDSVRRALIVEKLRAAITEWLSITDKEVEQEYRRRNDKVKLAVVAFATDSFKPDVTATDAEVASLLRGAQGRLQDSREAKDQVPARRRRRHAREGRPSPPADIERAYNDNIEQYSTPEQVRASHILLKTEGKDEATVKARAEDVLKQAKAGADFAALAKKYSEDEANARKRRRPRLLRPRPDGAGVRYGGVRAEAGPDQRSGQDAVRLPHHQADRQEGRHVARPLDEVRQQLTDQLAFERAQTQAARLWRDRLDDADHQAGRPRHGRQGAGADGAGDRASSPATSRSSGSAPRRKSRPARSR